VILLLPLKKIEIRPIGFVKRTSSNEDVRDKSLVSRIVLRKDLTEALDWVRGLDALDGTPVLDIKPYGCPWDVVVNFRAPKWFLAK